MFDRPVLDDVAFKVADYLMNFDGGAPVVFGRETKGLPEPLLAANEPQTLTIPMTGNTRSLNLATSVGIVLYEAVRQCRPAANGG